MEYAVFLSYRRADTSGHAGRICDDLERHFGMPVVFRDIEAIRAGSDFVEALESAVANARVAVVLIGDTWLSESSADGTRRIDDPNDHVRREVAMVLEKPGLTVVPVLVEGTSMPTESQLPEPLRDLARLHAIELSDSRWDYDVARLARVLETAGMPARAGIRLPGWFAAVAGVAVVVAIAVFVWTWQAGRPTIDDFTGLWHLPSGSYWTVRESDGRLWVEETHYDSGQVWKRGPATPDGDRLTAQLELVFERRSFRYLHQLRLSADRHSLVGTVRRSDKTPESSLVLTRSPTR